MRTKLSGSSGARCPTAFQGRRRADISTALEGRRTRNAAFRTQKRKSQFSSTAAVLLLGGLACVWGAGCGGGGPELAPVEGTVTLDGTPLPAAHVVFQPQGPGSPSSGITDENGHYELLYALDREGAMVGRHTVRITTYAQGRADENGEPTFTPERVPPRYNSQSELVREVESGSNTFDFPLEGALQ